MKEAVTFGEENTDRLAIGDIVYHCLITSFSLEIYAYIVKRICLINRHFHFLQFIDAF